MEIVLYYIKESKNLLMSFLILMFVLGILAYLAIRNFRQDKKFKIFFYGLFLRMTDIDILKMATLVIKNFLILYATMITNQILIWICLIMISIVTIIYMVCVYKRAIYQIISTLVQMSVIYFIYIINNYMDEVDNSYIILGIKVFAIIFILLSTIYLLFRDIDLIAEDRVHNELIKAKKNEKSMEGMERNG